MSGIWIADAERQIESALVVPGEDVEVAFRRASIALAHFVAHRTQAEADAIRAHKFAPRIEIKFAFSFLNDNFWLVERERMRLALGNGSTNGRREQCDRQQRQTGNRIPESGFLHADASPKLQSFFRALAPPGHARRASRRYAYPERLALETQSRRRAASG